MSRMAEVDAALDELTGRLVAEAEVAVFAHCVDGGTQWAAPAATTAVLRELSRFAHMLKPDNGSAFVTAEEIGAALRHLADYISEGGKPPCVRVFVGEAVGDTDEAHDLGCEHSEGGQSDGS